jgi:hypothetical protein
MGVIKGCINENCDAFKQKKIYRLTDKYCKQCGQLLESVCKKCHAKLENSEDKICNKCQENLVERNAQGKVKASEVAKNSISIIIAVAGLIATLRKTAPQISRAIKNIKGVPK